MSFSLFWGVWRSGHLRIIAECARGTARQCHLHTHGTCGPLQSTLEAQYANAVCAHCTFSLSVSRIAQIYGYSEEPFALFLKLYDKDLNGFLRDRSKMVPYWKLALDVSAGLAEIHSSRFIHADVKSEK